ncbi:hypothetical protein AAG906_001529 [Vitis piasezkii]
MDSKEENPSQKKYRGTTRKSMIIRNRNRGIKLVIKYNADGIYVGESSVHLTSYLGVLARTMVPIRYNTWRDVPEQLKDKLWDSIEIAFTLDKKSRRNCMLTLGKCFRSFKNTLTYKKKRKKHIYNHHLSRKGYLDLKKRCIDRSLLWKRAMQKKDGSYDDVVLPVVEKIDELMKESQDSGISYSGSNDILSQALGTPEYTGRVRAKGKHYTPGRYFNSMSEQRQAKFEADVLARLSQIGVATPQSDVSSSNMKSKLLLLPEVVEKPIRKVEEETLPVKIEPHMKARKCELAVGTEKIQVAGGTIVMDCGPNYLVVLDAPYESNGYQVLWPTHLVNLSTKFIKVWKAQGVEVPNDVFSESFKTFLMKEDMDMIISFKEVSLIAHRTICFYQSTLVSKAGMGETTKENRSRLIANRLMHAKRRLHFIPYNPDFHWVLVALDIRTMNAYYLDPMQKQPCDDLKEIGTKFIHRETKIIKEEPTWVKVVMPSFQSKKSCRSHFDDSHKFSSHEIH